MTPPRDDIRQELRHDNPRVGPGVSRGELVRDKKEHAERMVGGSKLDAKGQAHGERGSAGRRPWEWFK